MNGIKTFGILADGNLAAGATLSCDSINMKDAHRARFCVNIQAVGVASSYVLLYSGATDGAATSALTFRYAFSDAAQGSSTSDVFTTWSTSANLEVPATTKDGFNLLIEVEATDMDMANNEEWLTLVFADTDTGSTGNVSVVANTEMRYSSQPFATSVA